MTKVNIAAGTKHKTVIFAAEELKKYLEKLDSSLDIAFSNEQNNDNTIMIDIDKNENPEIDTVDVNIEKLSGTIYGSNPRSVLYAVYQYLEKTGIKWVRHGKDGEYIPESHNFSNDHIVFKRSAKYKHRCMCIEGALSLEVMLDNIDWVAKMGFNEYYIQGFLPRIWFDRWYLHEGNPLLPKQNISDEQLAEYKSEMVSEIKKRDLIYYTVGHGWHSNPLGLESKVNSADSKLEITEAQRKLLAMINGKRGVNNRVADTHLCYSNPIARKLIVDYVTGYCKEHPEMDMVFFPLADGCNNHCECDECSKVRPSDLYVDLLNELDLSLTKENISAKVVIAIYCDFLWAPTRGCFNNPDRFIYTYAPFHRTIYMKKPSQWKNSGKYKDMGKLYSDKELPPYVRNKLEMPQTAEELISFLQSWQRWQNIDAYDHEYYFYVGEHYFDLGSVEFAEIIYDDIKELPKYGLNGMLSCGTQRAFMPTGIGMWAFAKGLWDDSIPFETVKKEYFDCAFGEQSQAFSEYFSHLSKLAHAKPEVPFDTVTDVCKQMKEYIKTLDVSAMSVCHRASIEYVLFHCDLVIKQMAAEKITVEKGHVKYAEKEWKELISFVRENEMSVVSAFDVYMYLLHIGCRFYGDLMPWWYE